MSKDVGFECSKCGLCCRCLANNPRIKGTELEQWDRGDGVCKHLTKDNLCDIYDKRPDICNVDKLYEKEYCKCMTRDQYNEMQRNACEILKKTFGARNAERFGL